jgi:hypothetical protein
MEIPQRVLPPSALGEPAVLVDNDQMILTCEAVMPYVDGFEVQLRRIDKIDESHSISLPDPDH